MSLSQVHSGQIFKLHPLGKELPLSASRALLKTTDWEIMRIVLPAGKSVPEHRVLGAITLLCIEGSVVLQTSGRTEILHAGDMAYLEGGAPHALHAAEDASLLQTILLKHEL